MKSNIFIFILLGLLLSAISCTTIKSKKYCDLLYIHYNDSGDNSTDTLWCGEIGTLPKYLNLWKGSVSNLQLGTCRDNNITPTILKKGMYLIFFDNGYWFNGYPYSPTQVTTGDIKMPDDYFKKLIIDSSK